MPRLALLLALALSACPRPAAPPDAGAAPDHLGPPPPDEVRTVVTLAPSLTADVLALGAGARLVGVTRFDDDPRVAALPRVGGFSDPSVETILRLRPDLVLAQPSPGNRGAVDAIAGSGVPVVVLPLEESAGDVVATVHRLGALLGTREAAATLVDAIDSARRRAAEAARKRARRPRVAVLYGLGPIVAAGPGSYPHALLVDAGAEDVIDASPQRYPRVSLETLLAKRPDAILLAGMGGAPEAVPESLAARTITLKSRGFLQPGPLVAEALDELTAILDRVAAEGAR